MLIRKGPRSACGRLTIRSNHCGDMRCRAPASWDSGHPQDGGGRLSSRPPLRASDVQVVQTTPGRCPLPARSSTRGDRAPLLLLDETGRSRPGASGCRAQARGVGHVRGGRGAVSRTLGSRGESQHCSDGRAPGMVGASDGTSPTQLISCSALAKRSKSPISAHSPTAVSVLMARRQRSRATWRAPSDEQAAAAPRRAF